MYEVRPTLDHPYVRAYILNKVQNMNLKIFNLMSQVNEARFLVQHKSCECKCGLNESVSNSKQKWSHNKCRCDCKKLDD